jgi:UDP-N-acetylglucosamine/UDP-N-acetylgalactosamine diphosphorylase
MSGPVPADVRQKLTQNGQAHLLQLWDQLAPASRTRLLEQLQALDLAQIKTLVETRRHSKGVQHDSPMERALRAVPPSSIVRLPKTDQDRERWRQAHHAGEELLRAGKVGAILVAGGQGTRLGFDKPKGMYPIGPVSRAPLFQILAEQLLARSRRAGHAIPYFIMTSDATHDDTVAYFKEQNYFGLPRDDVYFFEQGNMPAVDAESGRLLVSSDQTLCTSPDGHGGMQAALAKAGLLDEMKRRGVEFLHYHQVDNPTAIVCDPVFIGFHSQLGCGMSVKVVAKVSAEERMGVAVDVDGKKQIIEYSDLPPEVARKTDAQGSLLLWAGSTAIHVFSRGFLAGLVDRQDALPFHVAHKKVPYCDEQGTLIEPQAENAYKFERFIFDLLPLADRALVLETDRATEFNPVKNASGADSPDATRAALVALYRAWLRSAGAEVGDSTPVEISPLFALDADEVRAKIKPGSKYLEPTLIK